MMDSKTTEHVFWKAGRYDYVPGMFIRNDLKLHFKRLQEMGLNPVGIKVDTESFSLEIIVENNDAYKKMYKPNSRSL